MKPLLSTSVIIVVLKPPVEKEIINFSVDKMVVNRKFSHSRIFDITCQCGKEIFYIWKGYAANDIELENGSEAMVIYIPHQDCENNLEEIPINPDNPIKVL